MIAFSAPDSMRPNEPKLSPLAKDDPLFARLQRSGRQIILGGVTLLAKIGEGGMGTVYQGWHNRLNVHVAVKILKEASASNLPRFLREGHITAQLDHPNLIKVLDIDSEPLSGINFMVMEYVKGCTAYEMLGLHMTRYGRPLSETVAVDICLCAARATSAAHRAGILHRDVKSENILIRSSDGVVKILDLGLAALEADAREETASSQSISGTLGFLAPELLLGQAPTPASDVYAIGATLCELLTGTLPYGLPYDQTYHLRQLAGKPPLLQKNASKIDSELLQVIDRCLDENPERRYKNASELVRALQMVLSRLKGDSLAGDSGSHRLAPRQCLRPKVLCVDDDPGVLEAVRDTLDLAGFETAGFTNPAQALNDLPSVNPDVAVLDLLMPRMNGVELAQCFRSIKGFQELAVLIISGETDCGTILSALDRGMTDYLAKPLNSNELVLRVKLLAKLRIINKERSVIETQLLRIKKLPVSARANCGAM
ncbi:MAG TPA: serine/threonine-protein kinase [Planctomycetota bacterium]|nr:serine/threonine-protein kinase [Planctomycetota bacterium]